jgi:hypothetical protein
MPRFAAFLRFRSCDGLLGHHPLRSARRMSNQFDDAHKQYGPHHQAQHQHRQHRDESKTLARWQSTLTFRLMTAQVNQEQGDEGDQRDRHHNSVHDRNPGVQCDSWVNHKQCHDEAHEIQSKPARQPVRQPIALTPASIAPFKHDPRRNAAQDHRHQAVRPASVRPRDCVEDLNEDDTSHIRHSPQSKRAPPGERESLGYLAQIGGQSSVIGAMTGQPG